MQSVLVRPSLRLGNQDFVVILVRHGHPTHINGGGPVLVRALLLPVVVVTVGAASSSRSGRRRRAPFDDRYVALEHHPLLRPRLQQELDQALLGVRAAFPAFGFWVRAVGRVVGVVALLQRPEQ